MHREATFIPFEQHIPYLIVPNSNGDLHPFFE